MHIRSHLLVNVYKILILLLLACPQPSFAIRLYCDAYSDIVAGRQSQSIVDTRDPASNLPLIEKLRSLPGGEQEYQLIQQRRLEWNKIIQTKFGETSIEKLIPVGLKENVQPTNYNSAEPRTVMISEAEFNVLNKQFLEYKPVLDKISELLQDADRLYVLLQRFWLETLIEKSVSNVNTQDCV